MEYWRDRMWWTIDENWQCIVCGGREMTWGTEDGECRCDLCHARYYMKNGDGRQVTVPVPVLKEEFRDQARELWEKHHVSLNDLTDEQWEEAC